MKPLPRTKTRNIIGRLSVGSRQPTIQLQITPLHWGLEFYCTLKNGWLKSVALKLGPLCFQVACFELSCEAERSWDNYVSVHYDKE